MKAAEKPKKKRSGGPPFWIMTKCTHCEHVQPLAFRPGLKMVEKPKRVIDPYLIWTCEGCGKTADLEVDFMRWPRKDERGRLV